MDSGVVLREQKLTEREGFVVVLEMDGKTGLGEVAPLPGFSHESIEDVYPQLVEKLTFWKMVSGLIINLCIHRSLLVYLWRS